MTAEQAYDYIIENWYDLGLLPSMGIWCPKGSMTFLGELMKCKDNPPVVQTMLTAEF